MELTSGTILFTLEGELVGIVVDDGGSLVVLPGQAVLDGASKLEAAGLGVAGDLGVQVQRLTPALATATGSSYGVIVAWVEPGSQASNALAPGDVVDTWEDQRLQTLREWEVRVARLRAGDTVRLGVRARGEARQVSLAAVSRAAVASSPSPTPAASIPLGLTMRRLEGMGSAVTRVAPGSAAERAGLARGDVVTRVGDVAAPTPQQLTRAFSEAGAGERLLVAVTRDGRHLVTALGQ
jgi:S1-C subfamily serine protease